MLLPLGSLQVLPQDKVTKNQCIITSTDLQKQVYLVQPWKCDFYKEHGLFVPYWMVKEAPSLEEANLEKTHVKVGSLRIPAFTNKKVIEKGASLLCEPSEENVKKRKTSK